MTGRRTFMMEMAALAALPFAWSAEPAYAATQVYDFSPEQKERIRAPRDPDAQRLLAGYRFVTPGVLTVAIAPFDPPIATYATDARSIVGSDPDYARLVADAGRIVGAKNVVSIVFTQIQFSPIHPKQSTEDAIPPSERTTLPQPAPSQPAPKPAAQPEAAAKP